MTAGGDGRENREEEEDVIPARDLDVVTSAGPPQQSATSLSSANHYTGGLQIAFGRISGHCFPADDSHRDDPVSTVDMDQGGGLTDKPRCPMQAYIHTYMHT